MPSGTDSARAALLAAVQRMLRPLVRLMLANQVPYPALANLLKSVYVEVADEELARDGSDPTLSRTTLLTGIYRKEVKRLREEGAQEQSATSAAPSSLGAQIVARWTGAAEYLDGEGQPRPLERFSGSGETHSFEALVASLSRDIRPRSVLDEWLRLGVVELGNDGLVRLLPEAFVPPADLVEKSGFFGRNLHDHMGAAAHNLMGGAPPLLERSVYYARLSPASVARLAAAARRIGVKALQTLNREAAELQQRDRTSEEANRRINFGVYFFDEPIDPSKAARESDDD